MNSLSIFVRQNRTMSFIVLSIVFSWSFWLLYLFGMEGGNAAFGPFLAALVVLTMTEGWAGVKDLLGRMVRWRVAWPWYLVALGLPILLNSVAGYLTVLFGAPAPSAELINDWPTIFRLYPLWLLLPIMGGAWEEPGWRGYVLPRFEAGRSRLVAAALLWLLLITWHLPLFFTGGANWVDILNMVGGVILYNWLYHRSGESVLLVMLIHAMNNAVSDYFFPMFTGEAATQQLWMKTLVWGAAAAVVVVANWRWWTEVEDEVIPESNAVLETVVGV